jgi:hypothetical protein
MGRMFSSGQADFLPAIVVAFAVADMPIAATAGRIPVAVEIADIAVSIEAAGIAIPITDADVPVSISVAVSRGHQHRDRNDRWDHAIGAGRRPNGLSS